MALLKRRCGGNKTKILSLNLWLFWINHDPFSSREKWIDSQIDLVEREIWWRKQWNVSPFPKKFSSLLSYQVLCIIKQSIIADPDILRLLFKERARTCYKRLTRKRLIVPAHTSRVKSQNSFFANHQMGNISKDCVSLSILSLWAFKMFVNWVVCDPYFNVPYWSLHKISFFIFPSCSPLRASPLLYPYPY